MRRMFGTMMAVIAFAVAGCMTPAEAKKDLEEANKLWDAGKKAEAVTKYEKVIDNQLKVIEEADKVPGEVSHVVLGDGFGS